MNNKDLTKIPLHEVLLYNEWHIDRAKTSSTNPVVFNEKTNEKLVISKKGENYLYFNVKNDEDRGNIYSFARNRGLNLSDLIKNYDTSIEIPDMQFLKNNIGNNITEKSEYQVKKIIQDYNEFDKCDLLNNALLNRRGFSKEILQSYQGSIRQDDFGNITIPQYRLQNIESMQKEQVNMLKMCGYTTRLNFPITKNKDGSLREKPLKNINRGNKGLEIIGTNAVLESIKQNNKEHIQNIIISENILDSMSLLQIRGFNPNTTLLVSTSGQFSANEESNILKTLDFMVEKMPNARINLAFDNDEQGRKYNETLKNHIMQTRQSFHKMPNEFKPFSKDFNDDLLIIKITNIKNLNQEEYDKWVNYEIYKYQRTKDGNTRSLMLNNIRKLDSIKPISQENREYFNNFEYKHKAVKSL